MLRGKASRISTHPLAIPVPLLAAVKSEKQSMPQFIVGHMVQNT